MGNKYEVYSWTKLENCEYEYVLVYGGHSLFKSLITMYKEKRKGIGCVKFYWR